MLSHSCLIRKLDGLRLRIEIEQFWFDIDRFSTEVENQSKEFYQKRWEKKLFEILKNDYRILPPTTLLSLLIILVRQHDMINAIDFAYRVGQILKVSCVENVRFFVNFAVYDKKLRIILFYECNLI